MAASTPTFEGMVAAAKSFKLRKRTERRNGRTAYGVGQVRQFIPDDIIATEYKGGEEIVVRSGGCTAGCGLCCEYMVLPADKTRPMSFVPDDDGDVLIVYLDQRVRNMDLERWMDTFKWASYHRVWIWRDEDCYAEMPVDTRLSFRESGDWLACRIDLPCEKLDRDADGDGWCTVFGTPDRPDLCQRTPRHPLDVEGIEPCTYKFETTNDPKVARVAILRATYERMKEEVEVSERERGAATEPDSS